MANIEALKKLLETYNEINGPVERLYQVPTAAEFAKLVHKNRPFIVKTKEQWPAVGKWTKEYLVEKMKGQDISVAETPEGYRLRDHFGSDFLHFVAMQTHSSKLTASSSSSNLTRGEWSFPNS